MIFFKIASVYVIFLVKNLMINKKNLIFAAEFAMSNE